MSGIVIQTLQESDGRTWSYGSNYIDGALRLFSVQDLLSSPNENAKIVLSEYRDLDYKRKDESFPKYAAISHSWTPSPEALRLSLIANRPLYIDIGDGCRHQISWHGLYQAARAARHLGCEFLWLDFVCLHQSSKMDKKLQIHNMGHIYESAKAVIVMPGGVIAAQDAQCTAPWITRAWTLQEATLCLNTYVLILHPEIPWMCLRRILMTQGKYNIWNIEGDLALSTLRDLLSSRGGVTVKEIDIKTHKTISSKKFAAKCFGEHEAVCSALEAIIVGEKRTMKRSAAWRSMWLRTSTKPQDMVFSVMHILGVQIEVDYTRTREDLILELAQRSASLPSWLDIGDDVPFDPQYGLIPAIPPFNPNHSPAYILDGRSIPVAQFITTKQYIWDFNIRVLTSVVTHYDGDLVCAEIFEIRRSHSGKPAIFADIPMISEDLYYEEVGSYLMVLGKVAWYTHNPGWVKHIDPVACRLRKSEMGIWERMPGLTYVPTDFLGGVKRSHLRIGGSPGSEITTYDCDEEEQTPGDLAFVQSDDLSTTGKLSDSTSWSTLSTSPSVSSIGGSYSQWGSNFIDTCQNLRIMSFALFGPAQSCLGVLAKKSNYFHSDYSSSGQSLARSFCRVACNTPQQESEIRHQSVDVQSITGYQPQLRMGCSQ